MRETARKHMDVLIEMERLWKDYVSKQDSGSYCEDPSLEFTRAREVWKKIRDARKELQEYESEL